MYLAADAIKLYRFLTLFSELSKVFLSNFLSFIHTILGFCNADKLDKGLLSIRIRLATLPTSTVPKFFIIKCVFDALTAAVRNTSQLESPAFLKIGFQLFNILLNLFAIYIVFIKFNLLRIGKKIRSNLLIANFKNK